MSCGLERTTGRAGAVAGSLAEASETRNEDRGAFFVIVRGLAGELCNEHRERRAALAIMQWLLLLDPPMDVREKLTADVQQLGGEVPVPAYSAPPPRRPAADGDVPAPGSFGRANRGGAAPSAGSSAAWVPPPPEMPPPWTPTPGRRRPRGRGTIGVVLMLCAMVSFCSRAGHRAPVTPLSPSASSASDAAPRPSYRSSEDALEARIRGYNARLESNQPTTPRIIPGRPMSDARPMDPTPAVDRPGYAGSEQ